jgi:hypothetical protein
MKATHEGFAAIAGFIPRERRKGLARTLLACSLGAALPASAVQYYNLTQLDPTANGNTYTPTAASTAAYSTATINGAVFTTSIPQAIVGTGVIDPFVRIHNNPANCAQNDPCVESGYNTNGDGSKPQFQTKDREGHNWNRTLNLNNIGKETIDGITYRTFILDINERLANGAGHDEFLSLDQFRLFVSDNATLDNYTFQGDLTSQTSHLAGQSNAYDPGTHALKNAAGTTVATRVFDMDQYLNNPAIPGSTPCLEQTVTGGQGTAEPNVRTGDFTGQQFCDRTVGLNYALNAGSGNGIDLVVRVPDALFDPTKPFVYLFSSFGELSKNDNQNKPAPNLPTGDFSQSAGFEEWSTLKATPTPIPATLGLLLAGGAALLLQGRTRRMTTKVAG